VTLRTLETSVLGWALTMSFTNTNQMAGRQKVGCLAVCCGARPEKEITSAQHLETRVGTGRDPERGAYPRGGDPKRSRIVIAPPALGHRPHGRREKRESSFPIRPDVASHGSTPRTTRPERGCRGVSAGRPRGKEITFSRQATRLAGPRPARPIVPSPCTARRPCARL